MSSALEGQADLLAVDPETIRVDQDAGQPPVGLAVVGHRHEVDAVEVAELGPVGLVDDPPAGDAPVEPGQLGPPEGGQQVGEPVVVADGRVLVVDEGVAGLGGQMAGPRDQRLGVATRACRRRSW